MSKLWAGRTSGEVSSIADDFNSSIRFDCKLYKQDITGSMAHAAMLGAQGIISQAEAGQLIDGLQGILSDLESGALEFDFGCEDIHMFVEHPGNRTNSATRNSRMWAKSSTPPAAGTIR